jgi:hypothetical protein
VSSFFLTWPSGLIWLDYSETKQNAKKGDTKMAEKKTPATKTEPKTKRGQGDSITLRLVKGDKRDDELRARLNDHVNELAKLWQNSAWKASQKTTQSRVS